MHGTILIFGGNRKTRKEKVKSFIEAIMETSSMVKDHPDIFWVEPAEEKTTIGIDKSREVTHFLSQKPFSAKVKVVVIQRAEKLTIPAQNALLKILEEPPNYATILLEAKTEGALLPTIVSRCQKICITTKKDKDITQDYTIPPKEPFSWATEMAKKEKEEIVELLEDWILQERQELQGQNNPRNLKNIKLILEVKKDLEGTNINSRLALEYLALHLR